MRGTCVIASILLCGTAAATTPGAVNVTVTPPKAIIYGPSANTSIGTPYNQTLAVGDLSGDGVDDLVVSAPQHDGPDGLRMSAGAVFVVFGPLRGGRTIDLAVESVEVTVHGHAGDRLGRALTVGDLNADGTPDLVMGGPQRPDANGLAKGITCILFGPLVPGTWDLDLRPPDLCMTAYDGRDLFGSAVAIGDVTGDGFSDLVVGAEWGSAAGDMNQGPGSVAVLRGPLAPGPTRDLSVTPPDVLILSAAFQSQAGHSVAIGDMSGDGIGDIIIGAPAADMMPTVGSKGRVDVVFGGLASPAFRDLAVSPADVVVLGADWADGMGAVVATADMDGDGANDLIASAPGAEGPANAFPFVGEVHVVRGAVVAGTVIDQVGRLSDLIVFATSSASMGRSLATAAHAGREASLLIGTGGGSIGGDCGSVAGSWWLEGTQGMSGYVNLDFQPPYLHAAGGGSLPVPIEMVALGDLDGDGGLDAVGSSPIHDGPSGVPNAGMLMVYARDPQRCFLTPAPQDEASLRVTREGDDVLLWFDLSGLGEDGVAVDIYRGDIGLMRDRLPAFRYRGLGPFAGSCALLTSPGRDSRMATAGQPDVYYLTARACPSSCSATERHVSSLGSSSEGERTSLSIDDLATSGCP